MKPKIIGLIFMIAGATLSTHAEEDYRMFMSTDGRSIEARIVEYNPSRNKLRIERRGKNAIWVGADVFSEQDRKYIKQWVAASMFLSSSNLRIALKKESHGSNGSKSSLKEGDKVAFEVELQNRSKQSLEALRIEYRYYIKNEGSGKSSDTERSVDGRLQVGTLKPGGRKKVSTLIVSLETTYKKVQDSYTDIYGIQRFDTSIAKDREDDLLGIWVRIYGPKVEGRALYRDVTYPSGLADKVAWRER